MGLGFVGGATKKYFASNGQQPLVYDKYKHIGSLTEVNRAEIVFICVPTPFQPKTGFSLSAVQSAIKALDGSKIVVIKSSVVPGTTERLQQEYPHHKILFNPEFLREVSAYKDLIHPDRQILGYTPQSKAVAKRVLKLLPKAPFTKIMKSREAEMVKYMANTFLALKVVFANEFYELSKALGLNYEEVYLAVGADKRINHSHLNVAQDGYRGYGGSCFPKDVNAILELAKNKRVKFDLLNTARRINKRLLQASGLSEGYFLKELHKRKTHIIK